ncbi:MAG: hypothetical protein WCP20_00665 [Desulfuromonadales bacterium]
MTGNKTTRCQTRICNPFRIIAVTIGIVNALAFFSTGATLRLNGVYRSSGHDSHRQISSKVVCAKIIFKNEEVT